MDPLLWFPLALGVVWLVWIRSTGRHLTAVRAMAGLVAVLVAFAAGVALVSELRRPMGEPSLLAFFGVIGLGAAGGVVGIVKWRGTWVVLLRWVGFVSVFVAPMLFFGAGLLAVAAGLFSAPALQPAEPPSP